MKKVVKEIEIVDLVSIENVNINKLYLKCNSKGKPLAIITSDYDNLCSFKTIALDNTFTKSNYYANNKTLKEIVSDPGCILEFDTMRELMQYCIDHGI